MRKLNARLVRISIPKQEHYSFFIQGLHEAGVKMTNMTSTDEKIQFFIARHHMQQVRKVRKKYAVKVKVSYSNDSTVFRKDYITFFGLLLLIVIPLILSNYTWKLEVEGPTVELEDQVLAFIEKEKLLAVPQMTKNLRSDFELRQAIMQQFREFSWIHITKRGSHLVLTPQLAPINEVKEIDNQKQHLIAGNNGVITHFHLDSGVRKVETNMTVYKGDLLVSGVIERGEGYEVIGANGEVFADYWIESSFTIPRTLEYNKLIEHGWESEVNWKQLGNAIETGSIQPLKKFLTVAPYYQFETVQQQLQEENMEQMIMPLLHEKILRTLPQKSSIKKENLLHVNIDDDTVKGIVLFLVNENIAIPQPIDQGD